MEQCEDLNLPTSHTSQEHVFLDDLPLSQGPQSENNLHRQLLLELCDTRSPLVADCVHEEAIVKFDCDGKLFGETDKPHEFGTDAGCNISEVRKVIHATI